MRLCFKILLVLACGIASADEEPTRVGYAYDRDTEEFLYIENHHEVFKENRLVFSTVEYRNPDDSLIARKTLDFTAGLHLPEFSLENMITGHQELARYVDSGYKVIFSRSRDKPVAEAILKPAENSISDAGFDNYIINNWQEIITGETFRCSFLVTGMTDFIRFRLYQDSVITENGRQLRVIKVEPDNFLIRAFAGTTRLYYDFERPFLLRFEGISNMRDADGDNYEVVINYRDPLTGI